MKHIYKFETYIDKINEGLISTFPINKTIKDTKNLINQYNISYNIKELNNNTFSLEINNYNKIENVIEMMNNILDKLFNTYGWFPSKLNLINIFGSENSIKFNRDYILNPSNNLTDVTIIFESKFDKIETNIPDKLYHLSIQQYDIMKFGIQTKSKSKLTSHDYDGRIYLCKTKKGCIDLINSMKIFYSREKVSILYSGKNPKRIYNKNTKWIIYEIDSKKAGIKKLYKDPNYVDGYYYLDNILPESIKIIDKE